jgi:HTH-type transcriptional regulator / antitoxin HipB
MIIRSPKELAIFAADQRKQLGLSQSEVAERVGLKQKTISAFENNPERTMLSTALLILSALHQDLEMRPKNRGSKVMPPQWSQEW